MLAHTTHQTPQQGFAEFFETERQVIEDRLSAILRTNTELDQSGQLWNAMAHGVLNGGKRIRALLCLEITKACGGSIELVLSTAVAIELIHAYSLIHDDLPCMDDDSMRRGKPTVHVAYNEALAVLAGDGLIPLAFEQLAEQSATVPHQTCLTLIQELAQAAGSQGLVLGQALDMAQTNANLNKPNDLLERIHTNKTGALFRFSCRAGAILTQQPHSTVMLFDRFGQQLGLFFQIQDDWLDITVQTETLGKTQGKDQAQGKLTFPSLYGLEHTEQLLEESFKNLTTCLEELPNSIQTQRLGILLNFMKLRTH